ncbi:hypothetical protein ASD21_16170 [Caulobacter sp. Root1455]|nr:hypothetical protein ASD38_16360 [Caulobacter sp. Root487D2Y]KQY91839.1 hypothetical protein ASD21_16170 [Caulobacter sp. Root1455]
MAALCLGAPALAQTSLAQTCRAPAPAAGQTVSGPVLHVIDGRTLCIAQGPTPDRWIPLRISPAWAALPVDRDRLMAATFAQSLTCKITGGGAVKTATCTLAGRSLEALLTEPATITQAKTWR